MEHTNHICVLAEGMHIFITRLVLIAPEALHVDPLDVCVHPRDHLCLLLLDPQTKYMLYKVFPPVAFHSHTQPRKQGIWRQNVCLRAKFFLVFGGLWREWNLKIIDARGMFFGCFVAEILVVADNSKDTNWSRVDLGVLVELHKIRWERSHTNNFCI